MVLRSASTNLILKSANIQNILTQLTKNVVKILSVYLKKEMYERNFHWENLTVQLGQFAAFLDTSNVLFTKLFESLVNFRKN